MRLDKRDKKEIFMNLLECFPFKQLFLILHSLKQIVHHLRH